jgi:serine/threonine protein kinase
MSGGRFLEHKFSWDTREAYKSQAAYIRQQLSSTVEEIATPGTVNQELAKYTRTQVYTDPRSKVKFEKILGSGSYGMAFAAIYPDDSNNHVVVKKATSGEDLEQEYFVGAYGVNLLCDIVPNLMYTYGYVVCGGPPEGDSKAPEEEDKAPEEEENKGESEFPSYEEAMAMIAENNKKIPEMCDDPEFSHSYLIVEKINGSLFEDELGKMTIVEVCQVLLQLFLTLQIGQDHPVGWQHWDLRTSNIMIKRYDYVVKVPYVFRGDIYEVETQIVPVIIDYGFSCMTHLTNVNGKINRFIGQVTFPKLYVLPGVIPGEDCFTLIYTLLRTSAEKRPMPGPDVKKLLSYLAETVNLSYQSRFNAVAENFGYIDNSYDPIRLLPPIGFVRNLLRYMKTHKIEKDIIRIYPYTVPICNVSTRDYPYVNISPSISQELCKATTIKSEVVCLYRKSLGHAYGISDDRTIAKDLQAFMKYETLPLPKEHVPDLSNDPSLEDLIIFSQIYMFVMYMKEFMSFSYYIRQLGLQEMFKLDAFLSSDHVRAYNELYASVYTYYFQIKQEFILKFLEGKVPEKLVWLFKYINKPPSIFDL